MATKPIKFLELHYTMTQFLIIYDVRLTAAYHAPFSAAISHRGRNRRLVLVPEAIFVVSTPRQLGSFVTPKSLSRALTMFWSFQYQRMEERDLLFSYLINIVRWTKKDVQSKKQANLASRCIFIPCWRAWVHVLPLQFNHNGLGCFEVGGRQVS